MSRKQANKNDIFDSKVIKNVQICHEMTCYHKKAYTRESKTILQLSFILSKFTHMVCHDEAISRPHVFEVAHFNCGSLRSGISLVTFFRRQDAQAHRYQEGHDHRVRSDRDWPGLRI